MTTTKTIKTALAATLLTAFGFLGAADVQAGSSCAPPPPVCVYKTVTVYETVLKPCVTYVTRYDHCGEAYLAKVVTYKKVRVPVTKRIRVTY